MKDVPVVDIFNARELEVIADLAKRLDVSEEKVLVLALRAYQLIAVGTHKLEEVQHYGLNKDLTSEVDKVLGLDKRFCPSCGAVMIQKGLSPNWLCPSCGVRAESIDHPSYYGGDTTYEAIKVIEAWGLGFCLGNAVKYICRFGKKDDRREPIEDLKKARWYLDREIQRLEKK